MSQPVTILFVHYGKEWIRGSERCLLDLITHLDKSRFKAVLWCNNKSLQAQAKQLNVDVCLSEFPILFGWEEPRFNLAGYKYLIHQAASLIKKHHVQLIHANSGAPCQWLNKAARNTKIPVISHLHANYSFRDRFTLGLYQVSQIVGVSHYVVKSLIDDKKSSANISVIPNGIDIERLESQPLINIREIFDIDIRDFIIATVGSLIPRKGMAAIITAVADLIDDGIPASLIIIGDGPEKNNLIALTKNLNVQSAVFFTGEVGNVFSYLRSGVDVFVSGAREEAFGLVFAEAGLASLAVIGGDVGGVKDVVIDNETGILLKENNSDTIFEAIRHLYYHPMLSVQMGKAGRARAFSHFSIRTNTASFERLYQQFIDSPVLPVPWYKCFILWRSLLKACRRYFYPSYSGKGAV